MASPGLRRQRARKEPHVSAITEPWARAGRLGKTADRGRNVHDWNRLNVRNMLGTNCAKPKYSVFIFIDAWRYKPAQPTLFVALPMLVAHRVSCGEMVRRFRGACCFQESKKSRHTSNLQGQLYELSRRSTHGVVAGVSRVTDLDLPRCRGRGLGLAATPVPGVFCVSSASMSTTVALLRSRGMTCPQCGQTCMRSASVLGTRSQHAGQRCDGLSWRVLLRWSRVPASSALYASIGCAMPNPAESISRLSPAFCRTRRPGASTVPRALRLMFLG